jgi:hypothetical protein
VIPVAEPLTAPLHPTVLDALRNTPAAPLANLPAAQVLDGMGLPALPQMPAALPVFPGAPVLPPLDPAALVKPITDLFGGFGNGQLGAAGALNPQTLLQNVMQAIQTATQFAQQGISLLQTMQSAGTQAATSSAVATQGTSAAVGGQALDMHTTMGAASVTVATGYAQMAAVAAKFAITAAALGPTLVTPPGQAALLATALETGAEATAITAKTKAELAGHTAKMVSTGTRVKPTCKPKLSSLKAATPSGGTSTTGTSTTAGSGAGTTSSTQSQLPQLLSALQGVVQPLQSAAQQIGQRLTPAPAATARSVAAPTALSTPLRGTTGYSGAATNVASSTPLSQWQQEGIATTATQSSEFTALPFGGSVAEATQTEEATMIPPMVPAAGVMAGAGRSGTSSTPESLINAHHGDELVGDAPDDVAAPVIGALVTGSGPDTPFSL